MSAQLARLRALTNAADWCGAVTLIESTKEWRYEAPATVCSAAWKAYMGLGDTPQAECWLDRCLAVMPDNPTWQRGKGDFHRDRKEWSAAAACYARATELRSEIASFHASLAYALERKG